MHHEALDFPGVSEERNIKFETTRAKLSRGKGRAHASHEAGAAAKVSKACEEFRRAVSRPINPTASQNNTLKFHIRKVQRLIIHNYFEEPVVIIVEPSETAGCEFFERSEYREKEIGKSVERSERPGHRILRGIHRDNR